MFPVHGPCLDCGNSPLQLGGALKAVEAWGWGWDGWWALDAGSGLVPRVTSGWPPRLPGSRFLQPWQRGGGAQCTPQPWPVPAVATSLKCKDRGQGPEQAPGQRGTSPAPHPLTVWSFGSCRSAVSAISGEEPCR